MKVSVSFTAPTVVFPWKSLPYRLNWRLQTFGTNCGGARGTFWKGREVRQCFGGYLEEEAAGKMEVCREV
jgi:hypothetical protein